ncbi:MAG: dihydropyrimidinase [Acidobacteriota bacterium]
MSGRLQFDLLVRRGTVVTAGGVDCLDVGVRDAKIAAVGSDLSGAKQVIDASGKLVLPGLIDTHTHMGIPIKDTHSIDDFASGSVAAAFGGTTTILDFSVQKPGQSLGDSVRGRLAKAAHRSHVDYSVHVNLTDRPEERLEEIPALIEQGFNSFKAFTTYKEQGMMIEWAVLPSVLARIDAGGGLLMLHAEENEMVTSLTARHLAAGLSAPIYHARSRPPEAEALAIEKASRIAAEIGARLYIVHLSSRLGLEASRRAKERGVKLYLETCPQYLVLDESQYRGREGHRWITTPPLRSPEDREALWAALEAGEIDTIGTDHCPFTSAQKDRHGGAFERTPNGLPGVENRLAILYTYGVASGRISLPRMVQVLAGQAARLFGIDDRKGEIAVGKDADLVIWDPRPEVRISAQSMHGNADFSPYEGMKQSGRLDRTLLRGQVLVEGEEFVGQEVWGQWLASSRPKTLK